MFESAYLKIDRAKQHISNLQIALDNYSNAARIEFQPDGSSATIVIDRKAEPQCSLILGDAVHNIHSALDHAYWELMGMDGGEQNRSTKFPIHSGGCRAGYEGSCKGIKTPRQDTKDFLIGIQAYPDGVGENLCVLHDLDIGDKHAILNPVMGLATLHDCVIIRPNGYREDWQRIGAPYETTVIGHDSRAIITPFGEGRFELNNHPKATLEILFGDSETAVELKPVMPVLDGFIIDVRDVLARMTRMVEARV